MQQVEGMVQSVLLNNSRPINQMKGQIFFWVAMGTETRVPPLNTPFFILTN